MLLQRSGLAARTAERPRLAPPWSIALIAGMLMLVLVVIYPHDALVKRVYEAPPGEVTKAYLTTLLRTDPENPRLRLLVARSEILAGQYDRVRQTLVPVLASNDQGLRNEATWLLWQSLENQFERLPANSPLRRQLRDELNRRLAEQAERKLPENELLLIARKAFTIGNTRLGLQVFERLAQASEGRSEYLYREAAAEALAQSEYRAAAEFYLAAARRAKALAERRRGFLDALRTLQAGDRAAEALTVAEAELAKSPELADDQETLILLITLARGARRPDLADKYVRALLRMALLKQWQDTMLALRGFDVVLRPSALKEGGTAGTPKLPFDDRAYTLGFDVFVENHKLEDAWKVAASAVRQAPDSLEWRERLAKVSDWSGRPRQALENWLYLARHTGRDDAWQAVLRLAPGLFDDDALRPALQYQLARHPEDPRWVRELIALYERLGEPRAAIRLLEGQYQMQRQSWLLEQMAEFAERTGDDAQALAYWKRYFASPGVGQPTSAQAIRVGTLMLRHGATEEALALLERAQSGAAGDDLPFWRLTASVANMRQRDNEAIAAYRKVIATPAAEEADYEALYRLLLEDHPVEAAQIAAESWHRFGNPAHLIFALGGYSQHERWSELEGLLKELDSRQAAGLRQQPDFLRYSALYHQHKGHLKQARQELEAALALSPQSSELQQALLWLAIDGNDMVALRHLLVSHEAEWRGNEEVHDALGAAYQALSLPDVALKRYLTPRLAAHRDDFLWLMNYADALEQNQEVDRAWRIRQHLLADERRRVARRDWLAEDGSKEVGEMRRVARARLAISQRPGDPAFAVLRELLRLDGGAEKQYSRAAKEAAAGWLQDAGQHGAERGWLWQQFAKSVTRPLWAEISVALADDDRAQIGELLDRYGSALPRYDRINAARRVDDVRLAQSEAFETQGDQPDDDEIHLQLTDAMLAHSDQIGAETTARTIGSIHEHERLARMHLGLTPRLTLDFALGSIARSNGDDTVIGVAPDEHYRSAELTWRHPDGETRLKAAERFGFAAYRPLQIEHDQRIDERLQISLGVGTHLTSDDSVALHLAGMKDRVSLGLRYRPTQRDQITVGQAYERYSAQTGTGLGSGQHLTIEYSHALRLEPRDLEAGAFWSNHRYHRDTDVADTRLLPLLPAGTASFGDVGPDFFLPDNFRFYGIRLSTDVRFEREYTRAWRPYASLARTWNSVFGPGYDLDAGIAGSVFGADHLRLGWKLAKGGQTTGGLVREMGLSYQLYF